MGIQCSGHANSSIGLICHLDIHGVEHVKTLGQLVKLAKYLNVSTSFYNQHFKL